MAAARAGGNDDLLDFDMSTLSYEDGIVEIDSFFNSSPDWQSTSPIVGDINVPHPERVGDNQNAAPSSEAEQTQATHQQHEYLAQLPVPEQQSAVDEFSTLLEDLDQVTAYEEDLANPKGHLDYNLNANASPAKTATESSQQPAITATAPVDSVSPSAEVPRAPCSADVTGSAASGQVTYLQSGHLQTHPQASENQFELTDTANESSGKDTQPYGEPVPLPSAHAEKGLTLLPAKLKPSPKPSISGAEAPVHQGSIQSSADLPSVSGQATTPTSMYTQKADADATMTDGPVLPPTSPEMPSSTGKSSLMLEMREEDDGTQSTLPPPRVGFQPNLSAPASTGEDLRSTPAYTDADRYQVISEAGLVQQRAADIVASRQGPPVVKEPEPTVRDSDETESASSDEDVKPKKGPMKAKGSDGPKQTRAIRKSQNKKDVEKNLQDKPIAQRRSARFQAPVESEETKEAEEGEKKGEYEAGQQPQRRETRSQPLNKRQENQKVKAETKDQTDAVPETKRKPQRRGTRSRASIASLDTNSDRKKTTQGTAPEETKPPTKRKAKETTAPQSKRTKANSRSKVQQENTSPADEQEDSTASASFLRTWEQKGFKPVGKTEMQQLGYGRDSTLVAYAARQTRGQKAEEEKKKPNAGRVAKERHQRKAK